MSFQSRDRSIASDWPLFRLKITTARLELRPVQDADLAPLLRLVRAGIHDSGSMPFGTGWTDRPEDQFDHGFAQYFWSQRGSWSLDAWALPFVVLLDARPIGVQQLTGDAFPITRTVGTGSWLGREFQGRGIGTEMRAAVLDFAFFELGAEFAITGAYAFNSASNRVSQKLGYKPNGVRRDVVRGRAEDALRYRLSAAEWRTFDHRCAAIEGLHACRDYFFTAAQSSDGATPLQTRDRPLARRRTTGLRAG